MRCKKIFLVLLPVLILNLIWEFCHYNLYLDLTGIPSTIHLILASFVDVFLVALIFLIISLRHKDCSWTDNPQEKDYSLIIISGLILAFVWELFNLKIGRWEYTSMMPLFFNVGLSPLLQLAITGTIGLIIYNSVIKK
jgi:hypothetical protein